MKPGQARFSGGTKSAAAAARLMQFGTCLQARGFVESLATGSRNSADAGLVRSVLAAGFYPLVWKGFS